MVVYFLLSGEGTHYILGSFDGFFTANVMSYERSNLIVILVGLFLAMVICYGRKKGIAASRR